MDIKNTLEVIDAMDALAKAIKSAKANGVIDWRDTPDFLKVIGPAKKALEDAKLIKLELQDLDANESQELVDRLFAAYTALADAIMS